MLGHNWDFYHFAVQEMWCLKGKKIGGHNIHSSCFYYLSFGVFEKNLKYEKKFQESKQELVTRRNPRESRSLIENLTLQPNQTL